MVWYLLPEFPEIKQMYKFMNVPVHPHSNSLGSLIHSTQQYLEQLNEITLRIRANLYRCNNKLYVNFDIY